MGGEKESLLGRVRERVLSARERARARERESARARARAKERARAQERERARAGEGECEKKIESARERDFHGSGGRKPIAIHALVFR